MSALAVGGAGNIQDKIRAYQAVSFEPLTALVVRELGLNVKAANSLVGEYMRFLDLKAWLTTIFM